MSFFFCYGCERERMVKRGAILEGRKAERYFRHDDQVKTVKIGKR